MKYYKLHLIRHGLTQGNLDGLYVGSATDLPLCAEGRAQLKTLRKDFVYPRVDTLFVSPLLRAKETAEILFPEARHTYEITNLKEMNFGKFEGKTLDELKDTPAYRDWISSNMRISPPNGEGQAAFIRRIFEGLQEILADMMKNRISEAALVCHGGVLLNLLFAFASPKRDPAEWTMEPGFGYALQFDPALWQRANVMEVVSPIPWSGEPPLAQRESL